MYGLAIDDNLALAIDDSADDSWTFHFITMEPFDVESFETPGAGRVAAATVNPETHAIWLVSRGNLYAASRKQRIAMQLPFPGNTQSNPSTDVVPFDVTLLGNRFYVACSAGNVWYYDRLAEEWKNPLTSRGTAPRDSREFAQANPDFYKSFAVGTDHYVVGARGRVVCFRGDQILEYVIEGGPNLVGGHAENGVAVICSDAPDGRIWQGSIDAGFTLAFTNPQQALHATSYFGSQRFFGAACSPIFGDRQYDGPALFEMGAQGLSPVVTGREREPGILTSLTSTGGAMWAIDQNGFFRLNQNGWDVADL